MSVHMPSGRRLPIGAEIVRNGVDFRVWAPKGKRVDVLLGDRSFAMQRDSDGYFSTVISDAEAGMSYRYRLDGGDSFPDPASRFQPEGPHGPSMIIDPASFHWSDAGWRGVPPAAVPRLKSPST